LFIFHCLDAIPPGFDAHAKDELNLGYLAVIETDFEWITDELVKIANSCCDGRVVSVLEGGYKIQGGVTSAFAQSVASHVRALHKNSREPWCAADNQWQKDFERKMEVRQPRGGSAVAAAVQLQQRGVVQLQQRRWPAALTADAALIQL
jgi:hypothetical protein